MKIYLFGSTGMLGKYVYIFLSESFKSYVSVKIMMYQWIQILN